MRLLALLLLAVAVGLLAPVDPVMEPYGASFQLAHGPYAEPYGGSSRFA